MAYTALCLVSYTLCLNSFLVAFPAKGFVADWRHLSSGLSDFRGSTSGVWRKDGNRPLETKHKISADGDYDVIVPDVAHQPTGDPKLENSEKTKRVKSDKEFKSKRTVLYHIFSALEDKRRVVRAADLRSQKPDHTPTLKESSRRDGEEGVKFEYGILRVLRPLRLENHDEQNATVSDDYGDDAIAPDDEQSVATRSLEPQKTKFRTVRKKRDNWNDEIKTMEWRLLSAGAEDEAEEYDSDECERCHRPARIDKRDTGNISVATTTPNPKANVSNNLNETSGRSENNNDDLTKNPIPRLLDMQITTSLPPSTTSKHGQRKIDYNHEEPRAATEMSFKSINVTTTEETGGLMGVEDDFAYITDPQEIHLGRDRETASGQFVSRRGKIITLHWTIKFQPKGNASGSGDHPHPPADDEHDVFEQTVYLDPYSNYNPEDGHTSDIPKHPISGGDLSEYLDQLPLPSGAAQVFADLITGELPPIGQDGMADIAIAPVMELLSQKPITESPDDWFTSQDGLLNPLDQPSSDTELVDSLFDMEPGLSVSVPSLQDELVDMETAGADYGPDSSLDEPADTELETAYFDPNTFADIPSMLEVADTLSAPDVGLLLQQTITEPQEGLEYPLEQPSSDIELVDSPVGMVPGLPVSIPSLQDELVDMATAGDVYEPDASLDEPVDMETEGEDYDIEGEDYDIEGEDYDIEGEDHDMETEDEDYDPDELLSIPSSLVDAADMESEGAYLDPNTLSDMPSMLDGVDTSTASDMELLLQQPITETHEDWYTPHEGLVYPLDQPESDTVLIDAPDGMEPGLPVAIPSLQDELVDMVTAGDFFEPDASVDEPVDMETDSAYFDPNTLADISSVLEVADVPTATDMELLLQQPVTEPLEDWFTPQEGLVYPLDQPESDTVLIDAPDGMEPGLPVAIPSLQDELVDMATAGDVFEPDASLEEPVDMESDSAYFDPNTLADISSVLEVENVPTATDTELLLQQPVTEPFWFTPLEGIVYPLDQPESETVLIDVPDGMESGLPVAIPSLQDEVVDMATAGNVFEPDASLEEPVDMESDSAYFDPNTITDISSVLEVGDVPTVTDMELILQQPVAEPLEEWFTPQEGLVYPLDQSESDTLLIGVPDGIQPGLPVSIPSLQHEVVDMPTTGDVLEPDASLDELVDMESDSAYFDPNTLADIPLVMEVPDVPTATDMELLLQQPVTEPLEDWFPPQEGLVYPLDQPESGTVLIDGPEGMGLGLPAPTPSLQDELVDMETAGEYINPAASISNLLPVDSNTWAEFLEGALTGEQSEPTTLSYVSSLLDEPVAMQPEVPLSLVEASTGEQFDPDTLSNIQSPLNEPDASASTAVPLYDEYGLEIYDHEDHRDHVDHTQASPVYDDNGLEIMDHEDHRDHIDNVQATTCRCEEVTNRVVTDRPRA